MLTPYIASYLQSQDGKKYYLHAKMEKEVLPISVAKRIQKILIKTVQKGTAVKAQYEGLEVGGKTGTAHIAGGGGYTNTYNSSFFGFANDKNNEFTIGVLVKEPNKKYHHFASTSAVPIFKDVLVRLVEEGYLTPSN
jgi:cell division protein FtsI (penicillin-binding protein 3)